LTLIYATKDVATERLHKFYFIDGKYKFYHLLTIVIDHKKRRFCYYYLNSVSFNDFVIKKDNQRLKHCIVMLFVKNPFQWNPWYTFYKYDVQRKNNYRQIHAKTVINKTGIFFYRTLKMVSRYFLEDVTWEERNENRCCIRCKTLLCLTVNHTILIGDCLLVNEYHIYIIVYCMSS
jgi:hypothetical protein